MAGKGTTSIVLLCRWRGVDAALKVRRTDSNRRSMLQEAGRLLKANGCGVGPVHHASSRNFIVMEYLRGEGLGGWLAKAPGMDPAGVGAVVRDVLRQARRLDVCGIRHRELSDASRHVLVGEAGVKVIDFETASDDPKGRNVSAVAQFMLLREGLGERMRRLLGADRGTLLEALGAYRRDPSEAKFEAVMKALDGQGLKAGF